MKWKGNLLFRYLERPKGLIDAIHGREKVEKTLFFDKVLIGKKSVLINESECQYLTGG